MVKGKDCLLKNQSMGSDMNQYFILKINPPTMLLIELNFLSKEKCVLGADCSILMLGGVPPLVLNINP